VWKVKRREFRKFRRAWLDVLATDTLPFVSVDLLGSPFFLGMLRRKIENLPSRKRSRWSRKVELARCGDVHPNPGPDRKKVGERRAPYAASQAERYDTQQLMCAAVAPGVSPWEREVLIQEMFQRNLHPFKSDEETDAWVAELQRVLGRMARTNQQLATSLAIPLPSRTDFLKHYERDITKALERSVEWHKSVHLILARMFVQPDKARENLLETSRPSYADQWNLDGVPL
jgi:hypothetical protein